MQPPTPLPIDPFLPEITRTLAAARSLVLIAEPGAGKTTRVPPAIIAAKLLSTDHPNLIMLQPRRVAARAVAARIAEENNFTLGEQVGYQVRFEKRLTDRTRIRVLTEGILTRQLLDSPFLDSIGCVILDEFHERSLHTDIALALLREVRETVRPDLLLLIMSATLDPGPIATYLNSAAAPAPTLNIPGRIFPIEISHAPPPAPGHNALLEHTARTILRALQFPVSSFQFPEKTVQSSPSLETSRLSGLETGNRKLETSSSDLLTFLPGAEEIRRVQRLLESHFSSSQSPIPNSQLPSIIPLFGGLTLEEQQRAILPDPQHRRKIILATNIAETSLTIDGVTTVIDTGLARIASYDAARGLDRLELKRISKASATQRSGRAGRTAPGRAIRLYSAAEDRHLKPFEVPEIRRVDLASTILSLYAWGNTNPRTFAFFEPPAEETITAAERLLEMLGALSELKSQPSPRQTYTITALGRRMLTIPAHPRLARLLLAAGDHPGNLWHVGATLAALLSERDILKRDASPFADRRPATQSDSDLLLRLSLLEEIERSQFAAHWRDRNIDLHAARQVTRTRDDLLRSLRQRDAAPHQKTPDDDTLLQLLLTAYPDRVVRRRPNDPLSGLMTGGTGVRLSPESSVITPELFIAIEVRNDTRPIGPAKTAAIRQATVTIASAIRPQWLETRTEKSAEYDAQRDRVVGVTRELYRDLVLREERHGSVDDAAATTALAAAARPRVRELFLAEASAAAVLARIALLRHAMPERNFPLFDDARLAEIFAGLLPGKRSLGEVQGGQLAAAVKAHLPYPLDRQLDELAPETIEVPSGSHIKIQYALPPAPTETNPNAAPPAPILAVRLQELFGWQASPRIAAGRVPLLLHLLSPAYRPVQITADLQSFWSRAYFEVRKDLRMHYPKHSWPEDPLTAKPEAKGRKRR